MQSNNSDDPPRFHSIHDTADRLVREILDTSSVSRTEISPSGELYRAIERFHREHGADIPSTLVPPVPPMSSEQEAERRRRLRREAAEGSPLFVLPPPPPPIPFHEPVHRERLAPSAGWRGGRSRPRLNRRRPPNGEGSEMSHAGRRLEAASSNLRSLLDDPIPTLSPPPLEPREHSPDAENGPRVKRRKLDADKTASGFIGFSYGKYGQVEPGKLKMEIVSCDGGIYQEHGGDYSAENVLRNDGTVYCTKSNRCNLVLRHQGATAFSLKELIIKAPHSGYTAPIQEGMVFISMTSDDLLNRTAQYQIQYSPPRSRRIDSLNPNELPPIISVRHNGDGTTMTTAQARIRRLYDIGLQDEECDFRTAQIPSDFTANAPPFQVTTEFSDSEGDEDPRPTPNRIRSNVQRSRFEESDRSRSSSEDNDNANIAPRESEFHNYPRPSGLRRRETASNITLAEAAEASQIATQDAVRAVGGELMVPHARFFIERDKSKCTVRFDPPVSGRFILLKMWSPHHSPTGNIDIQSVVAKGFAGPRFFPAVALR